MNIRRNEGEFFFAFTFFKNVTRVIVWCNLIHMGTIDMMIVHVCMCSCLYFYACLYTGVYYHFKL